MNDERRSDSIDVELELATFLARIQDSDATLDEIPESLAKQLTAAELSEYRDAQKCLDLLRKLPPSPETTDGEITDRARLAPQLSTPNQATYETPVADAATHSFEKDSSFGLPNRIGRFEVIRELGRGGFGIVLLAKDSALDRFVAIKIPRISRFLADEAQARFEREARAAASLSHPAIVPIFESGHHEAIPFIVFGYCEGVTLAEWLDQSSDHSKTRAIEPTLASRIVMRLAEAVQHAHVHGVVHRDLKPANILVQTGGPTHPAPASDGKPEQHLDEEPDDPDSQDRSLIESLRITDFGLARMADDSASLTKDGALIGTPAYMAPEQTDGTPRGGPAVDVYSLGVLLFELLTGRLPFEGTTQLKQLKAITEQAPPSPRSLQPSLSRDLSAICLKCIEKSPKRRYESCQLLLDDLERFQAGKAVTAREITYAEKCLRVCRRNPIATTLTLGTFAILLASTMLMGKLWFDANEARKSSTIHEAQARQRADEALQHSRRLRTAINDLLTAIANEPSIRDKGMESFREQLLVSATQFFEQLREAQPQDDAILEEYLRSMLALAQIHQSLDDNLQAILIAEEAIQKIKSAPGEQREMELYFLEIIALSQNDIGNRDASLAAQNEAIEQSIQAVIDEPDALSSAFDLASELSFSASLKLSNGEISEGRELNQEAIRILTNATGKPIEEWPTHIVPLQVIRTQAITLIQTGQFSEGKRLAMIAIDMHHELFAAHSFVDSKSLVQQSELHTYVGMAGLRLGQTDLSESHYDQGIDLLEAVCEQHSEVVEYHSRLIGLRYQRAMLDYSRSNFEAASAKLAEIADTAELLAREFRSDVPSANRRRILVTRVSSLNALSAIRRQNGELGEARDDLTDAIFACEDILAEYLNHPNTVVVLGSLFVNLASLDLEEGKESLAFENYRAAVEQLESLDARFQSPETRNSLAIGYWGLTTTSLPERDAELIVESAEKFLNLAPSNDLRRLTIRLRLAMALAYKGQFDLSLSEFDKAEMECTTSQQFLSLSISQALSLVALDLTRGMVTDAEYTQLEADFSENVIRSLSSAVDLTDGSIVSREQLLGEPSLQRFHDDERFRSIVEQLK